MIKPEQVSPEVVEAAADALLAMPDGFPQDADPDEYARAAIAAALAAWPGMRLGKYRDVAGDNDRIILPLTQEASDDQ